MRSVALMGEAMRRMYEISRPIASETAAVSDPALAVLMNASKGCSPPFSFMVMNALPTGVSTLYVLPVNARGRGRFGSGEKVGATSGLDSGALALNGDAVADEASF